MSGIMSLEQREILNKEWCKLTTVEEKLNFWQTKLPINYIVYKEEKKMAYDVLDWFDFEIDQPNFKKINDWILKNYLKLSQDPNKERQLLDYDRMTKEFRKRYDYAEDKNNIVRTELKNIDFSFKDRPISLGHGFMHGFGSVYKSNWEYNADYESYIAFLNYDLLPDYGSIRPNVNKTLQIANGVTLARYRKYVDRLVIKDVEGEETRDEVTDKYNVRIQLQMLHFLGVLENLKNVGTVEQKGVFFGALLNRNPQRARRPFSTKNILFDKRKPEAKNIRRDLLKVQKLFRDFGLHQQAKQVEKAIKEINQTHFPEDL